MEEIIFKEFTQQELTEAEKLQLEYWLKEHPTHQKIFAQIKLARMYPKPHENQSIKEKAWDEFLRHLNDESAKIRSKRNRWWRWLQVAAAISFITCISIY